MRLLLGTTFLLLILGCDSSPDLTGHWHLQPMKDGYNYVTNLDFVSDTSFLYNDRQPRWEGAMGYLDQDAKTMYWGGECLMGDWAYHVVSKNKIEIFDRQDKTIMGILTRKVSCFPPNDIFLRSRFAIELPIFKDGLLDIAEMSLVREIMVGPFKKEFLSTYQKNIQIALGDKILTGHYESKMIQFDLQHQVKIPEAKRDKLKVLIYLDVNTPLKAIRPILEHYAGRREHLYFAGLTGKTPASRMSYRKDDVCELLEKLNKPTR